MSSVCPECQAKQCQLPPPRAMHSNNRLGALSQLAHRVWLSPGVTGILSISELAWSSLESFSKAGWRQLLWTNGSDLQFADKLVSDLVGFSVMRVEELIPSSEIVSMFQHNVPIQHIKDEVALRAVAAYGGLFADCKLFWLPGRCLPVHKSAEVVFGSEPVKNCSRKTSLAQEMAHVYGKSCLGKSTKIIAVDWFLSYCFATV